MCGSAFPLVTLGAVGLGSTWAAIPPKLGTTHITKFTQVAVGILDSTYRVLDVVSYIPVARQISGMIRIALTIIAGLIMMPACKNDYILSAFTMLVGQVARGVFETFVPLPITKLPVLLVVMAIEITATCLNLTRFVTATWDSTISRAEFGPE